MNFPEKLTPPVNIYLRKWTPFGKRALPCGSWCIAPIAYFQNVRNTFISRTFWNVVSLTLQQKKLGIVIANKRILQSTDGWLNDRIMDAAHKLICKTLGTENT